MYLSIPHSNCDLIHLVQRKYLKISSNSEALLENLNLIRNGSLLPTIDNEFDIKIPHLTWVSRAKSLRWFASYFPTKDPDLTSEGCFD